MTTRVLNLFERGLRADDLTPVEGFASGRAAELIAETLRSGAYPSDRLFDRFLPDEIRLVSSEYWTPLEVVARAARWFEELHISTVVDIGSGAGKFCVAAALAGHCDFVGVEHRPRLVATARALARLFEVDQRVHFIEGALGQARVPAAEAYYLFNPFEENLFALDDCLDTDVDLSAERHARDIGLVEQMLQRARTGTYLLTYNGFGGEIPASYREVRVDRELPNVLRMWRKA